MDTTAKLWDIEKGEVAFTLRVCFHSLCF